MALHRIKFPLSGSFQRGEVFRTDDPLSAVWRQIERIGTVDFFERVAARKGVEPVFARKASIHVRQAVELRRASMGASPLTRPITLYYSILNLIRGIMLMRLGDIGGPSHGLRYKTGKSLFESHATVTDRGTFLRFAKNVVGDKLVQAKQNLTLKDALAVIPELDADFGLLNVGSNSVVHVQVNAFIDDDTMLRIYAGELSESDFRDTWQTLLPWFKDDCELHPEPFTLKVKNRPKDENEVEEFCATHLISNTRWSYAPMWFDHIVHPAHPERLLVQPIVAYFAALFILSNVCRYEPEYIEEITREATDAGYVLTSFLDSAERFIPQHLLRIVHGRSMYFE